MPMAPVPPQPPGGRLEKRKETVSMNPRGMSINRRQVLRGAALPALGPLFQASAGSLGAQARSRRGHAWGTRNTSPISSGGARKRSLGMLPPSIPTPRLTTSADGPTQCTPEA